jgi:6-phosphofructokinase
MSVAEGLSDAIKQVRGEESVVSDLTYDLRSTGSDFVDRLLAFTFAGMAMDALEEGKFGLMTAIREGRYAGSDSRSYTGPAQGEISHRCATLRGIALSTTTNLASRSS